MASKAKKKQVTDLLSQTFHFDWAAAPELWKQWDLVLDGLLDSQVDMCVWRLTHEYRGDYAPKPGMFKSWAKSGAQVRTGVPKHVSVDVKGRPVIGGEKYEPGPGSPFAGKEVLRPVVHNPAYVPEKISDDEYHHRMGTLLGIMSGALFQEIDWSNFQNLRESNMTQRAWLRDKLDWSPHDGEKNDAAGIPRLSGGATDDAAAGVEQKAEAVADGG